MKLKRVVLVQFYLHEMADIEIDGHTAFLGPNGSGKSSTLDAIQIGMLGGNLTYAQFNTQSVSSKKKRTISSYCLGLLRNPENDSQTIGRARDNSRTYIVLVFGDSKGEVLSAGLCVEASVQNEDHDIKGLFIFPGQDLKASDCIQDRVDGRVPLAFADFRESRRAHAKAIGRTPIFTSKSTEYVAELMYALNGRKMPDAKRFMSSFVKSMTLKNVDSIDQFVRDYVVEPNPVDVAGFRKQVEQFSQLREMVRRIRNQIIQLSAIGDHYHGAHLAVRRMETLSAIRAIFSMESHSEKMDDLKDRIQLFKEQSREAARQAGGADTIREQLQTSANQLRVALDSDSVEQIRQRAEERIKFSNELIDSYSKPEVSRARKMMVALSSLQSDSEFSAAAKDMTYCYDQLSAALIGQEPGTAVAGLMKALQPRLNTVAVIAEQQRSNSDRQHQRLDEERSAAKARIAAASHTGRLMGEGASNLLQLLRSQQMQAQPVSALASLIDPTWAPVLEAYLGSDRDALIMIEGQTQDAVRILRQARQRGARVDGAAVVQPQHLRDVDTRTRDKAWAVGMFETSNDTARRFLWMKFGPMRLVETETELEQYPRSMTKDGMLSQGGLTKSIRLTEVSDLRIGREHHDTAGLAQHVSDIENRIKALEARIALLDSLRVALSGEMPGDTDRDDQVFKAVQQINDSRQTLASLDMSHSDDLRKQLQAVIDKIEPAKIEHTKYVRLTAALDQQAKDAIEQLGSLELQVEQLRRIQAEAMASPLIRTEEMDKLKTEIALLHADYEKRIDDVQSRYDASQARLSNAVQRGNDALSEYVHNTRVDLQMSAMSWQERSLWCNDEKVRLTEVDLHRYEAEAEAARKASEDTLRSDVAMSLHDRFQEMEFERRDRNRILDSCPPFTGGERYKFVSTVVPTYESLVRYINQIAKDSSALSLFDDSTEDLDITLRQLVETAAESTTASALLDYRQFFTFDLEIYVDGLRVDRMSSRQGAGSNGEHIGPMYVSAGAALAKAYRAEPRKGQGGAQGFGLICLDEAFHGMDTTNALATARFLSSIGLQMIMAGPELERTKLAPLATTIYDLDREGLDLLMERTDLKEKANILMVSDMPSENPEVMKRAYQQLGFEQPSVADDSAAPPA